MLNHDERVGPDNDREARGYAAIVTAAGQMVESPFTTPRAREKAESFLCSEIERWADEGTSYDDGDES